MIRNKKAVIFDMDGVIVDSENLWKQAEKEIFSSLGVKVTDEYALLTQTMTTIEVTKFWYEKFPWQDVSFYDVEQAVISRIAELIQAEECCIKGVKPFIENLKAQNYKIGLATNSPQSIIPVVLHKSGTTHLFDVNSNPGIIHSNYIKIVGKDITRAVTTPEIARTTSERHAQFSFHVPATISFAISHRHNQSIPCWNLLHGDKEQ